MTFRLANADPEFLFKLALPFAYVLPEGTSLREAVRRPLPATGPYRVARRPRRIDEARPQSTVPRVVERGAACRLSRRDRHALDGNEALRMRLVTRGKADYTSSFGAQPVPVAPVDRPRLHVEPVPCDVCHLALDLTRPPFDDVRARRAVNFALDRRRMVRLGGGSPVAIPTCQLLPPNFPGYRPYCPYTLDPGPGAAWTAPDLASARRLVRASGTAGDEVVVWWHSEFGPQAGQYLEQLLRSLGYRARLRQFSGDFGEYFRRSERPSASWHVAGAHGSRTTRPLLSSSTCSRARRPQHGEASATREIDARIRRALRLQAKDPAAANGTWAGLDRALTDRAPWIFLYNPYRQDFVSKRVGNYQHHPLWGPLLGQLWVR